MRAPEAVGLVALVLVGVAGALRVAPLRDPPTWTFPLLMIALVVMLASVPLTLAGLGLLGPWAVAAWRRRAARAGVVALALLLLAPLPALHHHCTDVRGPQNPDGCFPGARTWMPVGVALASAGRLGPFEAFEFDETILQGGWALAPLAWVALAAGGVATLPRTHHKADSKR